MILFDFLTNPDSSKGVVSTWIAKKYPARQGRFRAKLDDLRQHGVGAEETLGYCPHQGDGIYKLKVKGKPQLRPHLCKGPFDMQGEATLLAGAIEENDELDPPEVQETASKRRDKLIADHRLRISIERAGPK